MFAAKTFLKTLTSKPGVYQMFNAKGRVIYVGKAKNLKKRVASYFRTNLTDQKTANLVSQIAKIEVIITATENEALLLENNLIKSFQPHYNIIFKDDKSFPYLFLTNDKFPRLTIHRGTKTAKGDYFGPFPSSAAVHETLNLLQKIFKLRQCNDIYFRNRTRPCLQFQIGRCSAPCVNFIDPESYAKQVEFIKLFLQGKSNEVINSIIKLMDEASHKKDYERAAYFRDQIKRLKEIQQQQFVVKDKGDVDVVALQKNDSGIAIAVLSIRKGVLLGSKSYFQEMANIFSLTELLPSFITQHYLNPLRAADLPKIVLVNCKLDDKNLLEKTFNAHFKIPIKIFDGSHLIKKVVYKKWLEMAELNAKNSLQEHFKVADEYLLQLKKFCEEFRITKIPDRIECFDVSHTFGEATIASQIVFGRTGALKNEYRKYNIKNIKAGDDYAAMEQVLSRRFMHDLYPDVLILDGGKGQLNIAKKVLTELKIDLTKMLVLAIAKGPERKPGLEEIFVLQSVKLNVSVGAKRAAPLTSQLQPTILNPTSPALHFLQRIRDEAHRFAISSQRKKFAKARKISILENVSGIGAARRNLLLKQFGGLAGLKNASIDDLAKVSGISNELAKKIYDFLHQM